MEEASYHRYDISDAFWEKIAPHLPGRPGTPGATGKDNRKFIGFCELDLHGGTYRQIMDTERMFIADSADGVTRECGNNCLKYLLTNPTLNG